MLRPQPPESQVWVFQEPNIKIYQLILVESRRPKHINTHNLNPRVDPTRRFDSICMGLSLIQTVRVCSLDLQSYPFSSTVLPFEVVGHGICTSNWSFRSFRNVCTSLVIFFGTGAYWCQFSIAALDFYYSEILPSSHGTAAGRHATVKAPKVYQPQTQGSCRGGHTHTHAHRCLL
jgi:hypothetical protein